jgi:hypothetical protein
MCLVGGLIHVCWLQDVLLYFNIEPALFHDLRGKTTMLKVPFPPRYINYYSPLLSACTTAEILTVTDKKMLNQDGFCNRFGQKVTVNRSLNRGGC